MTISRRSFLRTGIGAATASAAPSPLLALEYPANKTGPEDILGTLLGPPKSLPHHLLRMQYLYGLSYWAVADHGSYAGISRSGISADQKNIEDPGNSR